MTDHCRTALRASLPALLLVLVVLLPFLDKAFTMDDTVFMREAMHALSDPLHPTAFDMVWTHKLERLSTIVPTGPFMAWLLLPAAALGGAEWAAHAMQILMLAVACVATVSLALRLGLKPRWACAAGLLLAASPAVLGMAGTAMPDVPAMAFGIAGIERLVVWQKDRRLADAAAASVLLACGVLTRSHLLLLLAPAALLLAGDAYDVRSWFRSGWRIYVPLLMVPVIVSVMLFITRDPSAQGGTLAGTLASLSSLHTVPSNTVAYAVHLALVIPFTIPWTLLYYREILRSPVILLGAVVLCAGLLWLAHRQEAPYVIALVAGTSVAAFAQALRRAFAGRDSKELVLLAWMLVPLATVIYVHLPAKFLVPVAPAAAIVVADSLARRPRLGAVVLAVTLVAGTVLGVAILRADQRFAGFGRGVAQNIIAPQVARGEQVWFNGHWGFQWYAEQAGARCLAINQPLPSPGALVFSAERSEAVLALSEMKGFVLVRRLQDATPGGRINSSIHGSGFYSNAWGYLPWAWGSDPIEIIDIYRFSPQELPNR